MQFHLTVTVDGQSVVDTTFDNKHDAMDEAYGWLWLGYLVKVERVQ